MARQKSTVRTTQILIVWVLPRERRRGAESSHYFVPTQVVDGEGPAGSPATAVDRAQTVLAKPDAPGSA